MRAGLCLVKGRGSSPIVSRDGPILVLSVCCAGAGDSDVALALGLLGNDGRGGRLKACPYSCGLARALSRRTAALWSAVASEARHRFGFCRRSASGPACAVAPDFPKTLASAERPMACRRLSRDRKRRLPVRVRTCLRRGHDRQTQTGRRFALPAPRRARQAGLPAHSKCHGLPSGDMNQGRAASDCAPSQPRR